MTDRLGEASATNPRPPCGAGPPGIRVRVVAPSGTPSTVRYVAHLLEDILGAQRDESFVLSVCAARKPSGWRLVHGTLLAVPEACAEMSWSDWHRTASHGRGSHSQSLPAEVLVSGDTWLLARQTLTADEAADWLEAGTGSISPADWEPAKLDLPAIGNVPQLSAELSAPAAVLRVLPHVDSAISVLIAGLGRPAEAMMWAESSDTRLEVPDIVDVGGQWCAGPTRNLTGIHITPPDIAPLLATASGLLVGRAERRAWLRDSKGDGKFELFNVDLSWDPDLIGLHDLELTHEQFVGDDVASSVVIRLEDLDTEAVDDKGQCQVSLVSLGSKIRHGVTLRTVDGDLLDRSGPYPLVERVEVGIEINGQAQTPVVVGERRPSVTLDDRSERARAIEADVKRVLRSGAQARIIADKATAVARLIGHLEGARDELCILDRFFGQHLQEWRLLDSVPVPVRVLTGKLEKDPSGGVAVPTFGRNVTVRYRRKAPIHERIYFWRGGGIVLGGSPSTFGESPLRLTRLREAEIAEWRQIFEGEWRSPLYTALAGRPLV